MAKVHLEFYLGEQLLCEGDAQIIPPYQPGQDLSLDPLNPDAKGQYKIVDIKKIEDVSPPIMKVFLEEKYRDLGLK